MPSWVVPTVAAEYWGVSVERVMADVASGCVISRTEGGFTFVDVDPSRELAGDVPAAAAKPVYRRPLAWSPTTQVAQDAVVSPAERDALLASDDSDHAPQPLTLSEDDIPNWDVVRARVSRTRRPPISNAA